MASASPAQRSHAVLLSGAALALLSATGAPRPEMLAMLAGYGVTGLGAVAALHMGPVLFGTALIAAARALTPGRSALVRMAIYLFGGALVGMALSGSLDLFVGIDGLIDSTFGPTEPKPSHIIGWGVTGLALFWALMMGAIALFGAPAKRAISDSVDADADAHDIRPRERRISGLSAAGLATHGVSLGAITLLDQTLARGELGIGLVLVAILAAIANGVISWRMWRGYDEFMRAQVINAFAISSLAIGALALLATLVQGFGQSMTITAYDALLTVTLVQMAAALVGSASLSAETPRTARAA